MVIALFDSNILIDYLNGEIKAKNEIEKHRQIAISVISYLEVMVGVSAADKPVVEDFLRSFQILNFDETMTDEIVSIRNRLKIKLPDAIILATARANNAVLITRNHKDFPNSEADVVMPYEL